MTQERVAFFNGEIVDESDARISFRDRGFKYGDAVFDMTRTFGHRIFKLDEHLQRFWDSLDYVGIDPGITISEMREATISVLERNLPLLAEDEDYWVGQRVSRGIDLVGGDMWETSGGPTVVIECTPLPLEPRARLFKDGIDVWVPSVRRTPPDAFSPRAKSHNYLNLVLADMEAKVVDPDAWAILLDSHGALTEGIGSNIFTVKDGQVSTPRGRFVLGGISRETVIELAEENQIPVVERDIDMFDAITADEVFLTSTSLCICPVSTVQGRTIADGDIPGPITETLMDAYVDLVDYDWVGQYLKRLDT